MLSLLLQVPFALGLAVLLNAKLPGRGLLRTLFFAPYVLSEVVTGVVWRQILRPDGLLDQSLDARRRRRTGAGVARRPRRRAVQPVLRHLVEVLRLPHGAACSPGSSRSPPSSTEAAAIDGATKWQAFRHVTLPLLGPTIRVSVFLSVIGALQLFDLVWVTTKGGPIGASSTMATYLYDQFRRGLFGYASAVSIVIFTLSLVVALLYQRSRCAATSRGRAVG